MDYYQVPTGFGMALARNPQALNAYSAMTEQQKQAVLSQARSAGSQASSSSGSSSGVFLQK